MYIFLFDGRAMMRGKKRRTVSGSDRAVPIETVDYEESDLNFRSRMESMVPSQMAERIQKVLSERKRNGRDVDSEAV